MRRLKNSNNERCWGWILGSLVLGAIPGGGQVPAEDVWSRQGKESWERWWGESCSLAD